jgi:glycine dehydrogenase
MSTSFIPRHIGPQKTDVQEMLASVNANSLDELVAQTIPQGIRLKNKLMVPEGISEYEYAQYIRKVAAKNKPYKSYIGLGYYNCIIPPVIQRNVLENPGWYTAYTPYQAEIAQGRLEGLLNFQTMVSDLTAMPIANASLLDEATAAAEAMMMFYNTRTREAIKNNANSFFVDEDIFPQTLDVLKTRAKSLSVELVVGGFETTKLNEKYFGAMVQYPTAGGAVKNYRGFVEESHRLNIPVAVATDLLSLSMLTPPGEWGADVVFGSAQRFGVPMGYGGPHAAFFASKEDFKRSLPGRIIGVSVDRNGNRALRMALQTREQHIRRDKATSNICTAQALLAIMSGMYAVYHGPKGIRYIGEHTHKLAVSLADALKQLGIVQENASFFDTLKLTLSSEINSQAVKLVAEKNNINFRYINQNTIGISLDETTSENDVKEIVSVFAEVTGKPVPEIKEGRITIAEPRKSPYLTHPVFSLYHSETSMMRYLKSLENKDLSLTHSMISLGSCTMKLNAASELYPISIPEFANIHPFVPANQAEGYREVFAELEEWLADIPGFSGVCRAACNSGISRKQGRSTPEYCTYSLFGTWHKSSQCSSGRTRSGSGKM